MLFRSGIEIKVDRRDWLRELKDPDKAEAIARFCSGWIIAAPADIVMEDELPPPWGLLVVNSACKMKKKPEHHAPTSAIDAPFLASLLRIVNVMAPDERALREAAEQAAEDTRRAAVEEYDKRYNHVITNQQREIEELKKDIADFESKSGLCIQRWAGERIGEDVAAFRRFMDTTQTPSPSTQLEGLRNFLADQLRCVESQFAAFKELEKLHETETCTKEP